MIREGTMERFKRKVICILLSFMMTITLFPAGIAWAVDGAPEDGTEGAAGDPAASFISNDEDEPETVPSENTEITEDENNDTAIDPAAEGEELTEEAEPVLSAEEDGETEEEEKAPAERNAPLFTVDDGIVHGTVTLDESGDGTLSGTAIPDEHYDLATIRQIWTSADGSTQEQYLDYIKENNEYRFTAQPAGDAASPVPSVITAYFYDLDKWDGSVDITWYDPDNTEFEIGTPAQLAGLAAIVNGMVDENVTAEYMIKDNEGRNVSETGFSHEYISTESAIADLLTPNAVGGAGQVRDTVWRLPEVDHMKVGGASDDIHNDFLYRTVRLTDDLDMGDLNWTPIGGKYAMNRDAMNGVEARVVDTRFQGVFDGQGHTVTITCNRQAKLGFAYAMEIALIGYLGGGVDYKNGYPKDTYMDYENYWVPAVRNVIVRGSVKGRRMVAGVVGRTGETSYGVLVENCVNYADVEASDMRGCAGIVGAAWGKATIRNCYNAGTIRSNYWEHGGIVGSNGYEGSEGREPGGADIYNCYNAGETGLTDSQNSTLTYDGQEIGVDGEAFASYLVTNCYYIAPDSPIDDKTGYSVGHTSKNKRAKVKNVEGVSPDQMRSQATIDALNENGTVFFADTANVNNGYPVLWFQTSGYQTDPGSFAKGTLIIDNSESTGGTISAPDDLCNTPVPYGTTVDITTAAQKGYRFSDLVISDADGDKTVASGSFVTVCGKDITVRGEFIERAPSTVAFAEEDDGEDYYVEVARVYNGATEESCSEAVASGDLLNYKDRIKIKPYIKPLDTINPDIKNLEYTGKFGNVIYPEGALEKVSGTNDIYEVTGDVEVIELSFKPKTQGKRWTTMADTSWYKAGVKTFTITTARQLAGVAKLCEDGTSFEGVTILLGNDIDLDNTTANSGDEYGYERSWYGIGIDSRPFRGVFNGQGHTVRYMHRNFANGYCSGSNGGLFGVTEGAVIRNVRVEGGAYVNDFGATMECGFINGAGGGAIVGDAIDTVIENCYANVSMDKASVTGGIAGTLEGTSKVRNCVSDCAINGTGESVGGIAGSTDASDDVSDIQITGCTNNGSISSSKWKTGGILGNGNNCKVLISRCINDGAITASMKGTSSYKQAVGGILGYAEGLVTCSECVNRGEIKGLGQTYAQGGIAGAVTRGKISNCYNTGRIYSESTSKWAELAGIANLGTNISAISTVTNCYNIGKVEVSEAFVSGYKGGVIGYGRADTNVIARAYCSDESVASSGGTAGTAGEVVAADELKTYGPKLAPAFVSDLDGINNGFPVLVWQDEDFIGTADMVKVAKINDTTLSPSWKVTGSRDGVELWRALSSDGKYTKIYTGKALSYKNAKLTYGKTYYYKVRTFRKVDGKTYYGRWSGKKSYSLVPGKPSLVSVKNSKTRSAVIKWKKVSGASGYEIYRSAKKSSGYKKIATIKKGTTVSYTNKRLTKGKTYYYKVRSYKTVNKKKGLSAYSAVKYVKIRK